jgi:hypothetical protein
MVRQIFRIAVLAGAVGAMAACKDSALAVTNPNSGDTQRVLGTPTDAENLLGGYYKRWHAGVYGTSGNISNMQGMGDIFGMMNYSSLANNCMNTHAPWSNHTNVNAPGNTCLTEQLRLYSILGEVERVASNFLHQQASGLSLGSAARDARAKAYAEFLRGISIGYVALVYDSSAVVTPAMDGQDPGKLVGYQEQAESAYVALDRAITTASSAPAGGDGFPLPATWLPSSTTMTAAEFVKLAKSYRARFRAQMGRTPAEHNAAKWDLILADAQGGLTADHMVLTSTTSGPFQNWNNQYETFGLWHQMPPGIIGMGDVSGSYAAWVATPISARGAGSQSFFMVTPDTRFPQGDTRAAQNADFQKSSCASAATKCKRYFENRVASNDQMAGAGFGWSNYDFVRFHSWKTAGDGGQGQNGVIPLFTKAEVDMLAAEADIRKGDYASAMTLINASRTKNGLPALTAADNTTPVPGGPNCVPKMPVNGTTVACGTMLEAMKWEKRLETAYVAYLPWYLDSRGWGDLAVDTPLFWPAPYQDLQARGWPTSALYGAGPGPGNAPNSSAAKGTYGW